MALEHLLGLLEFATNEQDSQNALTTLKEGRFLLYPLSCVFSSDRMRAYYGY
jgi:hypothetical protein